MAQGPEFARADLGAVAPGVVAGVVDMFLAERGKVLERGIIDALVSVAERVCRT
ncbi:hypothetical protein [Arthrobacter sp. GMC3]|uniref:hypothetical protein n=1 Tax=Arthrobacter sp. GMC3 TaxID=2058894 RepID=UPI0015E41D3E